MIQLNTQGDTSPTTRTFPSGEPSSFMDKMSALAQRAVRRVTGNGNAGGSFSRITKMIPAVMLAVFAFSTAKAQVYNNTFDGPVFAGTHVGESAPFSGGSISGLTACSGDGYSSTSNGNYSFTVSLTVDPGYQLALTSISADLRKASLGGGTVDVQSTIAVDTGTGFINLSGPVAHGNSCSANSTGTLSWAPFQGTLVIRISGTGPGGIGTNRTALDNVLVNGVVSQVPCVTPINSFAVSTTANCDNGTIVLSGSSTGVNYQLYKNNVMEGAPMIGTGSALNWAGQTAGTYTVVATATQGAGFCSSTMTGSAIINNTPQLFTLSGSGNICTGATATLTLSGSEVGKVYRLLESGNPVGPQVAGTGAALTFTTTTAGTYTVRAANTPSPACVQLMSGTATVTVGDPTAAFASTSNNGESCFGGGVAIFSIVGTPNATVTYTVTGATPASINGTYTIGVQPDGTATINLNATSSNATVTLTNVQNGNGSTGCSVNLTQSSTTTSTFVVRPLLTASISSTEAVCENAGFSSLTVTTAGSGANYNTYARNVYYSLSTNGGLFVAQPVLNFVSGSVNGTNVTTRTITAPTPSTLGSSYTYRLDSIKYVTAPECKVNLSQTVSKTVNARPVFNYVMNGVVLTNGGTDTICMQPVGGTIDFQVTNATVGFTYAVTRNGAPFGASGMINNNGSGLANQINFAPAGTYVVVVTNPATNCTTTKTYTVVELARPTIAYYVNGVLVPNGGTVMLCAGQTGVRDSLVTANGTRVNISGSIFAQGNTTVSGGYFASNQTAGSAGSVTATITASAQPILGAGCDETMTFTVVTNPLPVVVGNVWYNNAVVSNNGFVQTCEDSNPQLRIKGTPGHTVEIHYNYGPSQAAAAFTQLQTGVIGTDSFYTWNTANGNIGNNWNELSDITCPGALNRIWYDIEIKNPNTWCSSKFNFSSKVNQKPSIRMGFAYNNTSGQTLTSFGTNGQIINAPTDTVSICYNAGATDIKYWFNWDATANLSAFNQAACGSGTTNTILFELFKGGVNGTSIASGSLTSSSVGTTIQVPVTAASAGLYTLVVSNSAFAGGCDSIRTFFVKANLAPVFTIVQTGNATVGAPATSGTGTVTSSNPVAFCEGYFKGVTVSGAATQTYYITRVSGPGTAQNFGTSTSPLTMAAGGTTHTFNALAIGTHEYRMTVASPGSCPAWHTFKVVITEMPKPTLKVNTVTVTPGSTHGFCQEEQMHFTIMGVPAGSPYNMYFGTNPTPIASGIAANTESSVITLVAQPNLAGTYMIKASNGSCDSTYSFTVNITDRPDITIDSTKNVLVCNGDNSGAVYYHYVAQGTSINTKLFRNGTQVLNSNSGNQALGLSTTNLFGGNYMLVISSNGCADTAMFTISEPANPVVLAVTGTDTACGVALGSVTFSINGGTAGYDVKVFYGQSTNVAQSTVLPNAEPGYTFSGLAPGTYTIQVTDALGCMKTQTFVIHNCAGPDLFPIMTTASPNFSLAANTPVGFTLSVYNSGQVTSTGQVQVVVSLPIGFSLTGVSAGWAVSTAGPLTLLTSTTAIVPGFANAAVITGNIVKTGNPGTGFSAIISNITPGSGGETNSANNSTITLFNVIN